MKQTYMETQLQMGTIVTIKLVTSKEVSEAKRKVKRAFEVIHIVETICSRFDEQSELSKLSLTIGKPTPVSNLLFEAISFALEVANVSEGIFDPTIGRTLEAYGFNTNYLTGKTVSSPSIPSSVSYTDVRLDKKNRTIELIKPLTLDLGAIAKGLAVDLAVKELNDFDGYFIDAGGDIYVGGENERNEPWTIGIRNPFYKEQTIRSLQLTNMATCTSGSYERISSIRPNTHHLINPHTGVSQSEVVSCTVIAPYTMMADAFSTVAFLLGPKKGITLLTDLNLNGMWISSSKEIVMTNGIKEYML